MEILCVDQGRTRLCNRSETYSFHDKTYTPCRKEIVIIGIGNIARMDDGVGVYVINHLTEHHRELPDNVEVIEAGSAVYDLVPIMMGRKKIVIVDALRIDDNAGTVYTIPSEELKKDQWGLLRISPELREIIFQCYAASGDIDIDFIGIVPENISACAMELSHPVKEKVGFAASEAVKAIKG